MRLFLSIEIPPDLLDALHHLRDEGIQARWTPLEQVHLTLHFIGEVSAEVTEAVSLALEDVRASPFRIQLKGTGAFPSVRRPHILWAGIDAEPALGQLHSLTGAALAKSGVRLEDRAFSPHVMLARLKGPSSPQRVGEWLDQNRDYTLSPFVVDHFSLFQSLLRTGGAEHIALRVYPLCAG